MRKDEVVLKILCVKGLSALISDAEKRWVIMGIHICTSAPSIMHLIFADDCFLFFRACEQEVTLMKDILTTYEAASRQAINLQKSEMYCSRNTSTVCRNRIATNLGVK